jgi:hypothetical protein
VLYVSVERLRMALTNMLVPAITECAANLYANNNPRMPEYDNQTQAFSGWPSSNVPANANLDVN